MFKFLRPLDQRGRPLVDPQVVLAPWAEVSVHPHAPQAEGDQAAAAEAAGCEFSTHKIKNPPPFGNLEVALPDEADADGGEPGPQPGLVLHPRTDVGLGK